MILLGNAGRRCEGLRAQLRNVDAMEAHQRTKKRYDDSNPYSTRMLASGLDGFCNRTSDI